MKVSEVLHQAWALINETGRHTKRAPARNATMEEMHALHDEAVCWDSTGAVQKVLNAMEGEKFDGALNCLRVGAFQVDRTLGVVEINDHGSTDDLQAMWAFAIRAAERVEESMTATVAA